MARITAFLQGLQELGWTDGRNARIEARWAAGDPERLRRHASELAALAPDIILASTGPTVQALLQVTRTIPIVFAQATDPVGVGFVESSARPGGNVTGFSHFEFALSAKLVELLKEIAPAVKRVAVLRDPTTVPGAGQFGATPGAASTFGMELRPVGVRNGNEIERGIAAFLRGANDGLIVPASTLAAFHRNLIVSLAAQHRLPAVYAFSYFTAAGGLASYGPDLVSPYRRAAAYVDRILRGEKPADLPVQVATKYELAINLKTARALGLTVPPALLARADEVIE